jgi:hypothetical protein
MPTLITRGAASAKAFGFAGLNPASVTFTANGTWVAPNNVTKVNMSGYGSPGVSDYTQFSYLQTARARQASVGGSTITATWQDYISQASGYITTMNTGSGVTTINLPNYLNNGVLIDSSNIGIQALESPPTISVTYVRGSAASSAYNWPPSGTPATNAITYATIVGFPLYGITYTQYNYGNAGTASTGISKTFPGGTYVAPDGYPASTTTFTNVTVTPGASYSIVVPSGGSITISYSA